MNTVSLCSILTCSSHINIKKLTFVFRVFAKYDDVFNCFMIVSLNLIVFLAHQSQRLKWAFPITWHLASFNFLNLDLLKYHRTKLDQAWMWSSMDGFLTKLCPVMLSFIQDYHQGFWLVTNLKVWKYSSEPLDYDGMKRNFSSQLSYCLKIFKEQGHILVVFGYWVPVQFYLCPPKLTVR